LLFGELVRHCQRRAGSGAEMERMLEELGAAVGERHLELLTLRDKAERKERKQKAVLQFIHTNVWRSLFGKPADTLEIYTENQYIISDRDLVVNRFVGGDHGFVNCGTFAAGVAKGVLEAVGFPVEVSAYYAAAPDSSRQGYRTNILVKFLPHSHKPTPP